MKYIVDENADTNAVENLALLQFAHVKGFPNDLLAQIKHLMALCHGGCPLVGTPDLVAEGLLTMHEAGFAGTTLSFVDYVEEYPYFCDNVQSKLKSASIRQGDQIG